MKTGVYEIEEYVEQWGLFKPTTHRLNRAFLSSKKIGFTLNVCCGTDETGDVRADIVRSVKPTIMADVKCLPFRERSFDTVICDPPYNYYNKFHWIFELTKIARKRIILSTPTTLVNLGKGWFRKIFYIDTARHFMRIWQVFTRDVLA